MDLFFFDRSHYVLHIKMFQEKNTFSFLLTLQDIRFASFKRFAKAIYDQSMRCDALKLVLAFVTIHRANQLHYVFLDKLEETCIFAKAMKNSGSDSLQNISIQYRSS